MFCKNCGMENAEGGKFCQGCGTPLEQSAPEQPVNQGMPNYAPVQRPAKKKNDFGQMMNGMAADVKNADKAQMTKAISVLLVILTVFTMMMGWAKIKVSDSKSTYNIVQYRRAVGEFSKGVNEYLDDYDLEDILDGSSSVRKYKATATKLTVANIITILDIVLYTAAFLLLAGYVLLLMLGNKNAAMVGQLANIAVAAVVVIFAIAVLLTGKVYYYSIIRFKLAFGLLLPLLAAGGNFALITLKKGDLKA